ncbi:hypothetical protein [Macrococcoides caseolyticum]|uniref:hypothetical protein n=1 Tax=Macrococcoides caseolyticum TaxID=69966 RepID=UPI0012FF3648|nr:hypothetical protein [Macrococcus caseolyticus]
MANKGKVRHLGIENNVFIAVCGEQRQSPPPRYREQCIYRCMWRTKAEFAI